MIRAGLSVIAVVCILGLSPVGWAGSSKVERVILVATEYSFAPSRLTFRVGFAYRLHFENRGKELHEFTAPAFLRAVEIVNREALSPEGTGGRHPTRRREGSRLRASAGWPVSFHLRRLRLGRDDGRDRRRIEGLGAEPPRKPATRAAVGPSS